MKENTTLLVMSLLSIVLGSFHISDDIVRGFEPGKLANLGTLPILAVWLYGTLVLAGRRSGYITVLAFSAFTLAVPYIHMKGRGIGVEGRIGHTEGAFFFVWTLLAMGGTALLSVILAVRGLWRLRRARTT